MRGRGDNKDCEVSLSTPGLGHASLFERERIISIISILRSVLWCAITGCHDIDELELVQRQ